ncbi:MAG TPA: acyl carrier protein [Vicinamibacterales bacterium]|nr:acyl carrier protein [Vicinamibacterales bacterium]
MTGGAGTTRGESAGDGTGGGALRELVRGFAPSWSDQRVDDSTVLGSTGLGLDSVALVELLLACEQRFGVAFPDGLLEARPLTIGTLIRHLEEHGARQEGG